MKYLISWLIFLVLALYFYGDLSFAQSKSAPKANLVMPAEVISATRSEAITMMPPEAITKMPPEAVNPSAKSHDKEILKQARIDFEKGRLKAAFLKYELIGPSSDYWLEAMEEKAHTLGRLGEYDKVISVLQTVTADTFKDITGPEPFFVLSLTHLKICAYSDVFKVSRSFKERFLERSKKLNVLLDSSIESEPYRSLWAILGSNQVAQAIGRSQLGALASEFPRLFYRDGQIINSMGFTSSSIRNKKIHARIRTLAKKELNEIDGVITKLKIIEADTTHRILLAEKTKAKGSKLGHFAKGKDYLQFPVNDEVWLDELDSYAAEVRTCPKLSKRAEL